MGSRFEDVFESTDYDSVDDDMAVLLDQLESLDDDAAAEFLPGLPSFLDPMNIIKNVLPGGRKVPPNVQQYPNRQPPAAARPFLPGPLPTPSVPGIPGLQPQLTPTQVQNLARQIARAEAEAVRSEFRKGFEQLKKDIGVVNNRVNDAEKKFSAELTKQNAVDAAQNRTIQAHTKRVRNLRQELERSTQTTLLLTLLSSGKKDYKITAASRNGQAVPNVADTTVSVEPAGGKLDMLLPLMLMGGGGGEGKGGMFDNPLLLLILAGAL